MANDYVFFDPRKKAQQQAEDEKKLPKRKKRDYAIKMGEKAVKVIADFIKICLNVSVEYDTTNLRNTTIGSLVQLDFM